MPDTLTSLLIASLFTLKCPSLGDKLSGHLKLECCGVHSRNSLLPFISWLWISGVEARYQKLLSKYIVVKKRRKQTHIAVWLHTWQLSSFPLCLHLNCMDHWLGYSIRLELLYWAALCIPQWDETCPLVAVDISTVGLHCGGASSPFPEPIRFLLPTKSLWPALLCSHM